MCSRFFVRLEPARWGIIIAPLERLTCCRGGITVVTSDGVQLRFLLRSFVEHESFWRCTQRSSVSSVSLVLLRQSEDQVLQRLKLLAFWGLRRES